MGKRSITMTTTDNQHGPATEALSKMSSDVPSACRRLSLVQLPVPQHDLKTGFPIIAWNVQEEESTKMRVTNAVHAVEEWSRALPRHRHSRRRHRQRQALLRSKAQRNLLCSLGNDEDDTTAENPTKMHIIQKEEETQIVANKVFQCNHEARRLCTSLCTANGNATEKQSNTPRLQRAAMMA